MHATMYMCVPLHCYCSLNIDVILLHTTKTKEQTASATYHAIATYVPTTNMPLKCQISDSYVSKFTSQDLTAINNET